jgi:hypothetical protein
MRDSPLLDKNEVIPGPDDENPCAPFLRPISPASLKPDESRFSGPGIIDRGEDDGLAPLDKAGESSALKEQNAMAPRQEVGELVTFAVAQFFINPPSKMSKYVIKIEAWVCPPEEISIDYPDVTFHLNMLGYREFRKTLNKRRNQLDSSWRDRWEATAAELQKTPLASFGLPTIRDRAARDKPVVPRAMGILIRNSPDDANLEPDKTMCFDLVLGDEAVIPFESWTPVDDVTISGFKRKVNAAKLVGFYDPQGQRHLIRKGEKQDIADARANGTSVQFMLAKHAARRQGEVFDAAAMIRQIRGNCSPPFGKITLDTVTAESVHGGA